MRSLPPQRMAMLRGLAAGATGAAAYNLYHDSSFDSTKGIAGGLIDAFQRKGAQHMQELSRMHKQVDDLQAALLKTLHDRGAPTVIVHGGGSGGKTAATGVAVVVGGAVLYLRFVKGWSFSDMMYVTKGALTTMQESVNQSLANVKSQVEAATADLVERLRGVSAQADEMLGKQEQMEGTLNEVDGKVDEVHSGVAALQHQVAYSNQAITLLCGALAEVAKRVGLSNGRYVRALDTLVHGAPGGGAGQQQRIAGEGAPAIAMLPAVDNLIVLEPGTLDVGAAAGGPGPAAGGSPAPRLNPAVFAVSGGSRAAAAVAGGAAPRNVASAPGSTGPAGGGSPYGGGGAQQGGGKWGRSVSDIVADQRPRN